MQHTDAETFAEHKRGSAAAVLNNFPNRLAASQPWREVFNRRGTVLLFLLAVCFVPRLWMATRINTVCPDGTLYLRLAESLEAGTAAPDTHPLQFGIYPLVLVALHRLGLPWETGAEWYGVLLSTLTVLPLYGWTRRQFDDRVALLAGLVYATHAKLIEWSPEAIRDPSFWFFFMLSLYCLWRAALEVRIVWYAAAGIVIAMSCMTRFEGLFLAFPLLGWTGLRWYWAREWRWRLSWGVVSCGGSSLLTMALVSWMVLGSPLYVPVRIEPVQRAAVWLQSFVKASQAQVEAAPVPEAAAAAVTPPIVAVVESHAVAAEVGHSSWRFGQMLWPFVHTLERGFTPVFAVLLVIGLVARFTLLTRSDNLPVIAIIVAVCAGIWIHLWYAELASSRYALTIVLMSTRGVAFGLLACANALSSAVARRMPRITPAAASRILVVCLGIVGTVDALSSSFSSRDALADLGRWIHQQYGDNSEIVSSEHQLSVIAYYARAHAERIPESLAGEPLSQWIAGLKPDVVILPNRHGLESRFKPLVEQSRQLGMVPIQAEQPVCQKTKTLLLSREASQRPTHRQASRDP